MDAARLAPRPAAPPRLRPLAELLVVLGLLEAELWSLRGWAPGWLNVAIYGALIGTVLASLARRRAERVDGDAPVVGAGRAWAEAAATCLALSTVLMVAAALVGDRNETFEFVFLRKPPRQLASWLLGKFAAALGQQLALQWFLWPACREVARGRVGGTVLAAALFGLVHLPSPTLVAITLIGGLAWVVLYQRGGRLAPLVASHMALATLAHGGLPERLTYDMRVGMTAVADRPRFEALADPKARQINRRLKEHRDELKHYASAAYYRAQGGTDAGLVRGLFRDILGRPAAEADVAFWGAQRLRNPREQIPSIFLASDEYARRLAQAPAPARR